MRKQIILTALLVFSIMGTVVAQYERSSHMKMNNHNHVDVVKKYNVEPEFLTQLRNVIDSNQKLVEAFLDDDNDHIKKAVTELSGQLVKVDASLLSGDAYDKWKEYLNEMKPEVKRIILANDIVFQRVHFAKLNEILYKSVRSFGTDGSEVYYNYCPMANLVGAGWLTTSNDIQNPYLGQKMSKCVSNKAILN